MAQQGTIGKHMTTVEFRKLDSNKITRKNGDAFKKTFVRYWSTDVVQFDDRWVTLDHGNWMTATTKLRMNQTANQFGLGFNVYQKNFEWFVATPSDGVIKFPPQGKRVTFLR